MMTDQGSVPDMPAPSPLTEDELAALEARARAARSGPWTAVMAGALVPGLREAPDCEIRTRDTANPDLGSWTVSWDSRHTGWCTDEAHPAYGLAHADAAYLAAAANAVPALLAEVRRLRAELHSIVSIVSRPVPVALQEDVVALMSYWRSLAQGMAEMAGAALGKEEERS